MSVPCMEFGCLSTVLIVVEDFFDYEAMRSDAFYNTSFYEAKRRILNFNEEKREWMKTLYFMKNTTVYTSIA